MSVVDQEPHRVLRGDRCADGRERGGHLSDVLRLAGRGTLGQLGHEPGQDAERRAVGADQPRGAAQARPHQQAQRAPWRIVVAREGPRQRDDRSLQRQPLGALRQQPRPSHPRRAGDHQGARAVAETCLEQREHLRVDRFPPHEGRLGLHRLRPRGSRPLVPNPFREGSELPTRLLPDALGQARGERMVRGERARRVALQRGGAQQDARRRLRMRLEGERPLRCVTRVPEAAGGEPSLRVSDQQRHRSRATPCPFDCHPIFERRRLIQQEPFQKVSPHQRYGPLRVAVRHRIELPGVDLQPGVAQRHAVLPGLQPAGAEAVPEASQALVEGVAGSTLGLLGPQDAYEMIPCPGAIGGEREIDEQCKVPAPQYFRGGLAAFQPGRRRAETDELEARQRGGGRRVGGAARHGVSGC